MPEYLAPGVYVEETSFRAKSIEGVATSTAGFVGHCRYGPVDGEPQLVTSFEEFQRFFGTMDDLLLDHAPRTNYLAHAVQLFFANGGRRVYVSRVFRAPGGETIAEQHAVGVNLVGNAVRYRGRFPGRASNLRVLTIGLRGGNLLVGSAGSRTVNNLRPGDVVEARNGAPKSREINTGQTPEAIDPNMIFFARFDENGVLRLSRDGAELDIQGAGLQSVQKVTLTVRVLDARDRPETPERREDNYQGLSTHPTSELFIGKVLRHENHAAGVEPPFDRAARIYLQFDNSLPEQTPQTHQLARELLNHLLANDDQRLDGGSDGRVATPGDYTGSGTGHDATGLAAIAEVDDIAIVAAPDGIALAQTDDDRQALRNRLITHSENLRYRFAILSANRDFDTGGIRQVRAEHDSKYAALYYPWLVVRNPFNATGAGRDTLQIPPDGAIAGIYARSDIERGVHKAPANEVVRNVLRFSRNVSRGVQDVLNPEGINCLRFFEGRGYRVWGARTISSDPEWTYLNVRRLFIFLEHSIDRSTQWAVFEPNNEQLWLKIRLTIESFLYDQWRTGALMGTSPEEAYFVRCDRTTMSQGDLDNGRLVCLIGVAPTKPAEFVIFRIGQWTADASIV